MCGSGGVFRLSPVSIIDLRGWSSSAPLGLTTHPSWCEVNHAIPDTHPEHHKDGRMVGHANFTGILVKIELLFGN